MRLGWKIVATLLVTACFMHWFVWIAFGAAVWLAVQASSRVRAQLEEQRKRDAEIVRRADQQHNWVLQGDERGVYGVRLPDLTIACNHR